MTIRNGLWSSILFVGVAHGASAQAPDPGQTHPQPTPPAPKAVPLATNGAAASVSSAPPAVSQAAGPGGTFATVLDISAIQGLMGRSVKSNVGEDLGRIVDCLVTPSGQARAVVIDFGGVLGVGSRKVAVDWKALDFTATAKGAPVVLALTRNEVRVSPEYKVGDPVVVLEATKPSSAKATLPASDRQASPQAAPISPPVDPQKN